jgi:cytidylate kinase
LIITLDGPAGSGKSTVARQLARRLGLEFLDTGAMYRGITAQCLDDGIDPKIHAYAVEEFARDCTIRFDWKSDPPRLFINNRDVTARLRDSDVTAGVSDVAAMPDVRRVLVQEQRQIGRLHPRLVTEGRDQGSVVFPTAQVKFFLTASPEVRAARRAEQLRAAGRDADERQILQQIVSRDQRDSTRKEGPLIKPVDAEAIDTSGMSLDGVLDMLEQRVRSRVGRVLAENLP